MSGARLDLEQNELALAELEIRELDPSKVFEYSIPLFWAYSDTLEVLGRNEESERWAKLAKRAEQAINPESTGESEAISVLEEIEIPLRRDEQIALDEERAEAELHCREAQRVSDREASSKIVNDPDATSAEGYEAPVIELDFGDGRPSTRKPRNEDGRGKSG
jgi:hypothetical protein